MKKDFKGSARLSCLFAFTAVAVVFGAIGSARAAGIIDIPESAFQAGAGKITFSEVPLGTLNPTFTPADYGGGASSPTVTFGGFFAGQSLTPLRPLVLQAAP